MVRRAFVLSLSLLTASSITTGCRPVASNVPGKADRTPTGPPAVDDGLSLDALADRIDPGPAPGLLEGMPKWAQTQYGLDRATPDPAALVTMLGKFRALPDSMPSSQRLGHAVELGFATIVLEHGDPEAVTDPVAMAALAQIYGSFDMPALFDPKGLFGSMIGMVARGLAQNPESGTPDDARAAELLTWLEAALGRLPKLHRRMAARMLRDPSKHPQLPDVMDRLAGVSTQEPGLSVALRKQSVRLRGRFATAGHHRELAWACYVDLDTACGDVALAAAQKIADPTDAALAKLITDTQAHRDRARRIAVLDRATKVDEQLERARLFGELGRTRAAAEAYAKVRAKHPRDARAVAGEIDAKLRETFDFAAAYVLLEAAGTDLEHKERKYLELAVGIRAMQLMYIVLPKASAGGIGSALTAALPLLEPVRHDVGELAKLGVDKARVIVFLLALGDELIPSAVKSDNAAMMKVARGLLPRALELRRDNPTSRYAYDVVIAAAQFAPDGDAALAAMNEPLPVIDGPLAMRAAMTRLALALTFDKPAEIATVTTQIEAWPESFGAAQRTRALARVDAVQWRTTGDVKSRDRAISRYETIVVNFTAVTDIDDACNFAVLLAEAGRKDDAALVIGRALSIDANADLAKLHRAALASPVDLAALETLGASDETQIAIAALGSLIAVDTRPGQRAKWSGALKKKQREPALRPRELPNKLGLGVGSSLQVGVGYTTNTGLELNIDAGPTPRLFVIPPKR